MKFNTLDDFEVDGKTVFVRVDVNSPIDPDTREILDDNRIIKCQDTIKELSERDAKVVVLAHQGRPGSDDFTTMEKHAEKMSEIYGKEVNYIDDTFGPAARQRIEEMEKGEILLLENARFYSEEVLNRDPEVQAKTHLVRKLSPLGDLFVNNAFAAAHRSQPTLVGFGVGLPAIAGRLMEEELKGLGKARNPEHPCVYLLGGAKAEDSIELADHVLERDIADKVLIGGLVGQVMLAAKGVNLGDSNMELIEEEGFKQEIENAEALLSKYDESRIKLPKDVRVETNGGKAEVVSVSDLPVDDPIYDIGDETIKEYAEIIEDSKTVVANGPVGVFEKEPFAKGTNELLRALGETEAYTVIGGGHMVASARRQNATDKIDHVSTGGGSLLSFLSGEKLPVVEMLEKAAK
ncbi:MAG: phosphoglycerate kinase [Candidatus Hadarchaeia archaeon]